jgi:hypothetical protein
MKSIIFKENQVKQALKERKGVFRVVMKPQPVQPEDCPNAYFDCYNKGHQWNWWTEDNRYIGQSVWAKFKVGETIFVKEDYDIAFHNLWAFNGLEKKTVNARYMKQEQSRLTLRITGVNVERLAEISEEDCIKEGVDPKTITDINNYFRNLWNSTHKKPEEKWEANPWVWVYEYEVLSTTK